MRADDKAPSEQTCDVVLSDGQALRVAGTPPEIARKVNVNSGASSVLVEIIDTSERRHMINPQHVVRVSPA